MQFGVERVSRFDLGVKGHPEVNNVDRQPAEDVQDDDEEDTVHTAPAPYAAPWPRG